jgi:hypothetical protein
MVSFTIEISSYWIFAVTVVVTLGMFYMITAATAQDFTKEKEKITEIVVEDFATPPKVPDLEPIQLRNCVLLSLACYEPTPESAKRFIEKEKHGLSKILFCDKDVDGAFIIATAGDDVYLAVRGSYSLSDWNINFSAWAEIKGTGIVHAGFYCRMLRMPFSFVREKLVNTRGRVFITGHSLGGAVATLITAKLLEGFGLEAPAQDSPRYRLRCVTFGAPLAFAGDSAQIVDQRHRAHFTHYVLDGDIVPRIFTILQESLNSTSSILRESIDSLFYLCKMASLTETRFAERLKKVKMAEKSISSIVSLVMLQYRPVGEYIFIDKQGKLNSCVPSDRMHCLSSLESLNIQDITYKHKMSLYASTIIVQMPNIGQLANGLDSLVLRSPTVRSVELIRSGPRYSVRFRGENLYLIKTVSAQLGVCVLEDETLPDDLYDTSTGDSIILSAGVTIGGRLDNVNANVTVRATTLFSDMPITVGTVVPVIINRHELDDNVLQDLLTTAIVLFSFADETRHNDAFIDVRDYLIEIFRAVRAELFFGFHNPFIEYILRKSPTQAIELLQRTHSEQAFSSYKDEMAKFYKIQEPPLQLQTWHQVVKDAPGKNVIRRLMTPALSIPPDVSILDILVNCENGEDQLCAKASCVTPDRILDLLLQVVSTDQLRDARRNLELAGDGLDRVDAEKYLTDFGGNIGTCIANICLVSDVVGKYFNRDQKERGTVPTYIDEILKSPFVQYSIKAVGASATLGAGTTVLTVKRTHLCAYVCRGIRLYPWIFSQPSSCCGGDFSWFNIVVHIWL